MNLNKVFLIGNLTRDPEQRTLPSGRAISNFGLATNRIWSDPGTGEKQQQVEFHNIVAFGKLADICNQYLTKGKLVYIEGRIRTRSWNDQDGNKRYRTEIIAEHMQMGPRVGSGRDEEIPEASETVEEVPIENIEETEENPKKKKKSAKGGSASGGKKNNSDGEIDVKDIPF